MSTGHEPSALVEHFFRHEFGRLGAVLTRSLGVRRPAFAQTLETWTRLQSSLPAPIHGTMSYTQNRLLGKRVPCVSPAC